MKFLGVIDIQRTFLSQYLHIKKNSAENIFNISRRFDVIYKRSEHDENLRYFRTIYVINQHVDYAL